MNSIKKLCLITAAFIFLCSTLSYSQNILTMGDKAPELKVAKWVKGTPVSKLEEGKFYVVEFWATWCGPCRESIPHLTELAHKYNGKVTFIGVDVWESIPEGQTVDQVVGKFLKEMGDKMDYNVALDTESKDMATNWMEAAAQNGIPAAFVVGKDSKIAWIGHPMDIDEALGKILEGTFDGKEFAAKLLEGQKKTAESMALSKKFKVAGKPIIDAVKAKDYKKVIEECDKLLAADPSLQSMINGYYIQAYVKTDPAKAIELADKAAAKSDEEVSTYLYSFSAKGNDKKLLDYVITSCGKLIAKNPKNLNYLYLLANTYDFAGNKTKAIETFDTFLAEARDQKLKKKILPE